jgi:hypothetical protein
MLFVQHVAESVATKAYAQRISSVRASDFKAEIEATALPSDLQSTTKAVLLGIRKAEEVASGLPISVLHRILPTV